MRHTKSQPLVARAFVTTLLVALSTTGLVAQQGQQGAQQGPGGGGGGGGQPRTLPYAANDTTGFTRIFRPGSLAGWDGDPTFWRLSGDTIIAESTPEKRVTENTFLIYRGDPNLRDFELKLEVRFPTLQGNSGVQVRSSVRPGAAHQWRVTGYQVDMDAGNQYTGQFYGEQAGGFLAPRGEMTHIRSDAARPQVIASLGSASELRGLMNTGGWNQVHIIAKGNTLTSILNGRVAAVVVDDALTHLGTPEQARLAQGLIALQMHTGAPFVVQFRNIFLKKL